MLGFAGVHGPSLPADDAEKEHKARAVKQAEPGGGGGASPSLPLPAPESRVWGARGTALSTRELGRDVNTGPNCSP